MLANQVKIGNTAKLTFKVIFSSIGILIACLEILLLFLTKIAYQKMYQVLILPWKNKFVGEFCGIAKIDIRQSLQDSILFRM
ncbi:MAG: hypothetical protein AB7U43_07810 [Desulfobacter sp.]